MSELFLGAGGGGAGGPGAAGGGHAGTGGRAHAAAAAAGDGQHLVLSAPISSALDNLLELCRFPTMVQFFWQGDLVKVSKII